MNYKLGDKARCRFCDAEIEYMGKHWRHTVIGFHKPTEMVVLPVTSDELIQVWKTLEAQYTRELQHKTE